MEQTSFNIEDINEQIEYQPYLEPLTQEVLKEWFKVNDSIELRFESRDKWKDRENILEKEASDETRRTLYLPEDLNLFEMIDVVKVVDEDTFSDNPEKAKQGVERIQNLAETFKKAGVYIDSNKENIEEAKDIATELSRKFYNYGLSLELKTKKENEPIQHIELSEEDKRELDKWLIGKDRYYKVMSRLGLNPSQAEIDKERQRHFKAYFKALSLKGSKGQPEEPIMEDDPDKPKKSPKQWERVIGPVARIHEATTKGVNRKMEQPSTELLRTVFNRGKEKLAKEQKVSESRLEIYKIINGRDLTEEKQRLFNYLKIPEAKKYLEEARMEGDIQEISRRELEIAQKINAVICSEYSYKEGAYKPSEIIKSDYLNCLGSTLLGTSLLDEVGIKYLYVFPPEHSMTFLLTSDGQLYWQDFTPTDVPMIDRRVTGSLFEGNPDILTLAENLDSFYVVFKGFDGYGATGSEIGTNGERFYIFKSADIAMSRLIGNLAGRLFELEEYEKVIELTKMQIGIDPSSPFAYLRLGSALFNLGKYDEAIDMYKKGREIDPNNENFYFNLGNALFNLGKYDEAIDMYKKSIEINQNNENCYFNLGNALFNLGKYDEAIDVYKKSIEINPNDAKLYNNLGVALFNLGKYDEAIEIFKKGIEIDPNNANLSHNLRNFLRALGRL